MKYGLFYLTLCVTILSWGLTFAQDVVKLEDGSQLEGTIIAWSVDETMIYFKPLGQEKEPFWIPISDIKSIEYGANPARENPPSIPHKENKNNKDTQP